MLILLGVPEAILCEQVWILKGRRKEDDLYRAMWEHGTMAMLLKHVWYLLLPHGVHEGAVRQPWTT